MGGLKQDYWQNYVDGNWVDGGAGRLTVENPGTGEPLAELREKLRNSQMKQPDYDWDAPKQEDRYKNRLYELSAAMFESLGIAREDKAGRAATMGRATQREAPSRRTRRPAPWRAARAP